MAAALGVFTARRVVIASGAYHTPAVPAPAADLSTDVVQLHSSRYQGPEQVPVGEVVVVGAGNTGVQIAAELASAGRRVALSVAELGPALPQRLLGRDIFWWFTALGTMGLSGEHPIGRRIKARNPIIGTDVRELLRTVTRRGRVVAARGRELLFADGVDQRADAVLWATGFRPHYPWLRLPVLDTAGAPVHREA